MDKIKKMLTIPSISGSWDLLLMENIALPLDLTGLLMSVDGLFDMVGGVFLTKIIRCFHRVIQGGNIDEEKYYLQVKSI